MVLHSHKSQRHAGFEPRRAGMVSPTEGQIQNAGFAKSPGLPNARRGSNPARSFMGIITPSARRDFRPTNPQAKFYQRFAPLC